MNKLVFIDKAGSKRAGIIAACKICNHEFITRKSRPSKYCSELCKYEGQKTRVEVECGFCKKKFLIRPSQKKKSKSGIYFCNRKCKDKGQRLENGLTDIWPDHYGLGNNYRQLFTSEELVCNRCGYHEFKTAIDIHHVDHNRQNNDKKNLLPLCCNCHMAYHRGEIKEEEIQRINDQRANSEVL